MLLDSAKDLRCRITLEERHEVVVDLPLRWRKLRADGKESFLIRPLGGYLETWLIEGAVIERERPPENIRLLETPAHVARAFCEL